MTKITVISHPIQGLVKYHGLKDPKQRIPFHDSISACVEHLHTKTTVETLEEGVCDHILINGILGKGQQRSRIESVLNRLRRLANRTCGFRVSSENDITGAKGLGYSASGFSALGLAAAEALGLELDPITLQEVVRLGAGSATRSLAGGFAIWYANKDGRSYAEMLASPKDVRLRMVIIPLSNHIITDSIHKEMITSPFFRSRLEALPKVIELMRKAIINDDVNAIGRLAEQDSLSLHATTMTTRKGLILMRPETIRVIDEVREIRRKGLHAWFSLDTGPSVFVNTVAEDAKEIAAQIENELGLRAIISCVGGPPCISTDHLF